MPSFRALLQPATGTTPGFRAHLKHPLPELPRIALGLWALSLHPLAMLLIGSSGVGHEGKPLTAAMVCWMLSGLALCSLVWVNPWPTLGMRLRADWRSAMGDLSGMLYMAALSFPLMVLYLPNYTDYRARALTGELLLRATETRDTVAEQLLVKQAITPRQVQLPNAGPTPAQQWLGVEADGRIWLFRSDLPALMWLTPQVGPEGVRWHCRGMGKPGHFPAACREGAAALSR